MNLFVAMGRLTRDVEMRYGANGNGVASMSLAVDRRFKREGQADADFFNLVAFGKTAEFCEKYLSKGTKVVVQGEVQNNDYTNKDGQKVHNVQIVVNQIEFAESKKAADQNNNSQGFIDVPEGTDEVLPFNFN